MLPQNGQNGLQSRSGQQQSFMSPSSPHTMNFESPSHMNLDASAAAKQMASLSAVGLARLAKVPPGPSAVHPQPPQSGSASYMAMNGHSAGFDSSGGNPFGVSNSYPNIQGSNSAPMPLTMADLAGVNRQQPPAATLKQRQRNFLNGLNSVMAAKNSPLPPALTGVPNPQYDPSTSLWKTLEPSTTEIGAFRLAGKDVDLFKLWGLVFQAGGHAKLTQMGAWQSLLPQFGLPETTSVPRQDGQQAIQPVARVLQHYYQAILGSFEELYRKNVMDQQRKASQLRSTPGAGFDIPQGLSSSQQPDSGMGMMGQPQSPLVSSTSFALQPLPPSPHLQQPSATPNMPNNSLNMNGIEGSPGPSSGGYPGQASTSNILDHEQDGLSNKRKLESEEPDIKRARQKTGSEPPENISSMSERNESPGPVSTSSTQNPPLPSSLPPPPKRQISRRKIEYHPIERDLETHGGRDLRLLEDDWSQRKPLRDVNEWGKVDIEAVTMSLRSRISFEVSYALTTLTLISTMKGQTPGTGFPITQCEELMDELLDLLEEEAFNDIPDTFQHPDPHIITHRDIVNAIHEDELRPFASLEYRQGEKDRNIGPKPRPGHTVLVIMNVLRNLTIFSDNHAFMASHTRFLDLFLRVSSVVRADDGRLPRAASPVLTLSDVITARKDTLHVFLNLSHMIHLSPNSTPSKNSLRTANRVFELMASYIVDPEEAISPVTYVRQIGLPHNGPVRPPSHSDIALQVFTLLAHPDMNRQVFAQAVSQPRIWSLFEALVHRLPIVDLDFQLMAQDIWLGYLEKLVMAIYALAFLSPPSLKKRMKVDRALGFSRVMMRMVQKFLLAGGPQGRAIFMVSAKRAVEAMKLIDDGRDSFDTSEAAPPTLSFGMGWGEVGDNGPEKGTGLLGGYIDVTWDLLMQREVDEMMFSELESLTRVE